MDSDAWRWIAGGVLILANAFFVAAEYALVGARPNRLRAAARKGSRAAGAAAKATENMSRYVAGVQLAITMAGIGLGWTAESTIANALEPMLSGLGLHVVAGILAFLIVTFLLVVLGELVPKYVTLRDAERSAVFVIYPLNVLLAVLRPFSWLLEGAGALVVRAFGIDTRKIDKPVIAREELADILKESTDAGTFGESHAKLLAKTLALTDLQADDVMIPRVDISFVEADISAEEALQVMAKQTHTRLVVVEDGDLDEIVGILHVQDALKVFAGLAPSIRSVVRPAVFVPPNLSLERLVERMQAEKTQLLVIRDEHGGTEGLLTLEDIVEEMFGELDDQVEHAQPRIGRRPDGRVVMRGDVRTDELCEFLGLDECPLEREAVATIIVESLKRIPRPGDSVDTAIGRLRVENMARQRITRVALIEARKQTRVEAN
ncbi:MAG: hypothetical protein AKCLJLPJ_00643 [Fimbriimonadales bacterium]|nr:MAG: HlyC/CorC family transporter [Armatimonadota bacterium]MBV6502593.1 hypothetical protein [Fimbriimonadales bacterium]MCE7898561.1 HlyC/CorC family transporter [Armatimonadetes bacterium ATM1]MDL1928146.1 HlyC/CorC family transporter [Fimbriimonadia bacterium ATM]MBC6968600.1 HlyC/CorC family transporter [Armatimonadota bacterium]